MINQVSISIQNLNGPEKNISGLFIVLQPFAKMLALLDLEINKTHQNPILWFGSSLAHLSVAMSSIVIGSV